ncbi:MAG TPA: TerC family protein [Cytophagaceae bacterium]|jgi:predicted tellurium resistance membrane protein TerC|nr:TerC family protein [Cytophagaceae bacterium]
MSFSHIFTGEGIVSLLTLTIMEIVLGIDNVIFISILAGRLPFALQKKARTIGLSIALLVRVALLFVISYIAKIEQPLFSFLGFNIDVRDIILISGGLFLIYKSMMEINEKLEGEEDHESHGGSPLTLNSAIFQIVVLDIVFSFDSILTAVGLVRHVSIMILAVVFSLIIMLAFSGYISDFINRHPTVKMLALSFLLMIGIMLVLEGLDHPVPKQYIYFAMAFSLFVEMLNLRVKKKEKNRS